MRIDLLRWAAKRFWCERGKRKNPGFSFRAQELFWGWEVKCRVPPNSCEGLYNPL